MAARRGNLVFIGGILAVAALVVLAYVYFLAPQPLAPPPVATSGPAPATSPLRLIEAEGGVERRRGGGDWQALQAGSEVSPGDDLRTKGQGRAAFAYGGDVRVDMSSDSQLRLEPDSDGAARVIVGEGLAVVDVRPESGRLVRISAKGSDAITETRNGKVHVLNDGAGHVQTAVLRGQATVKAQGRSVDVAAGFATRVDPGKPPESPTALPASLLLKVKWPNGGATTKKRHLITGTANPGARVRVGDMVVLADQRGRFQAVIELAEGSNRVQVRAVDVAGHEMHDQSPAIEVDTRAPSQKVDTSPEMWKHHP